MRNVLSLTLACLATGLATPSRASAQYPVYAPASVYAPAAVYAPDPVYAPQYLGQVVPEHPHHDYHHCAPSAPAYYSGYGASAYQYAPSVSYLPVYGAGSTYAPPVAPQSSINYYSNNSYYGAQQGHTHHGWHLGHYLMGHH